MAECSSIFLHIKPTDKGLAWPLRNITEIFYVCREFFFPFMAMPLFVQSLLPQLSGVVQSRKSLTVPSTVCMK